MNCDWKMTGRFPIMRPNLCCTILHACIWAELLLTLNADDGCLIETRVHVNTSYEAVVGEQFKIECGVAFCEEAPPTVDWIKREQTDVPVNVRSSSRIQTQWEFIDKLEGISILTFHKVRLTDSGVYQCQSGGSSSHNINVFVNVDDGRWRRTTVPQKNEKECLIETKVHEDTSYKAVVGEYLKIECGVAFCEKAQPTVDWIKLRLTDSGVYQCQSGESNSHYINVFVNGLMEAQ
ncbi:B- and T-lymphocyte attenuator-like [Notothenia coriiceps]|uniref:B- and T-lymphocyte attenuator-like n=1 Tax=Notothenia coriiceps TaxID=8208 RepID=A0A6I9NQR2_9TELE|nr:PREDICTED: B- and T-lymphocyte attenuator-like [Notothenia coriiceps]